MRKRKENVLRFLHYFCDMSKKMRSRIKGKMSYLLFGHKYRRQESLWGRTKTNLTAWNISTRLKALRTEKLTFIGCGSWSPCTYRLRKQLYRCAQVRVAFRYSTFIYIMSKGWRKGTTSQMIIWTHVSCLRAYQLYCTLLRAHWRKAIHYMNSICQVEWRDDAWKHIHQKVNLHWRKCY